MLFLLNCSLSNQQKIIKFLNLPTAELSPLKSIVVSIAFGGLNVGIRMFIFFIKDFVLLIPLG
jgi:hypothetical protein